MATSTAVSRGEQPDRANLEDALEVRGDRHLLVQLRRLREARCLAEIIGREDAGAALASH